MPETTQEHPRIKHAIQLHQMRRALLTALHGPVQPQGLDVHPSCPAAPAARHQRAGTGSATTLIAMGINPGRRSLISPLDVLLHYGRQIPPRQRQSMPQGGQLG